MFWIIEKEKGVKYMAKKIIMSLLLTLIMVATGNSEPVTQAATIDGNNSVEYEVQDEPSVDMQVMTIDTVEVEDNHLNITADNLQTCLFNLNNITAGEENLIFLFKDSEQRTVIDHIELTRSTMQELNLE